MKLIISFDPGSIRFGYAVFFVSADSVLLVRSGVCLVQGDSLGEKLFFVFSYFSSLISSLISFYSCRDLFFVVERIFVGKNPLSCVVLAAFYSHCFFIASYFSSPCAEFLAVEVKKFVVGNGRASKRDVEVSLCALFSCLDRGLFSDEYDAIALGYYYVMNMRPPFS